MLQTAGMFFPVILLILVFLFGILFFRRLCKKREEKMFGGPILTVNMEWENRSFSVGIFESYQDTNFHSLFGLSILETSKNVFPREMIQMFINENKDTIIQSVSSRGSEGFFVLIENKDHLSVMRLIPNGRYLAKQELSPSSPRVWSKGVCVLRML